MRISASLDMMRKHSASAAGTHNRSAPGDHQLVDGAVDGISSKLMDEFFLHASNASFGNDDDMDGEGVSGTTLS